MRLGADPEELEALAAQHEVCAAHLARVRTRLRRADRRAWVGPAATRWWATVDDRLVPAIVVGGDECAAAARRLRVQARTQRAASLAPPPVRERPGRRGEWVAAIGERSADVVVVLVPGVGTDLGDRPRLRREATQLWRVLAAHGSAADRIGAGAASRVAVVSWLGYDPPDHVLGGLDRAPAIEGAARLIDAVGDLRSRGATRVVVVGHSYGALVASRAAASGMPADELVLLGAPGLGVPSAESLGPLADGHLWAAAAPGDPVALLARTGALHGPDPTRVARRLPTSTSGHGGYLTDTALLDALAELAVAGVPGEPVPSAGWEPRSTPRTASPRS